MSVEIETGAGAGIGASDAAYLAVGAKIAANAAAIFAGSELIVKVKEPQPSEWAQLREDQILFAYLHLAPDPRQAEGLMASQCTAVAYETVTWPRWREPAAACADERGGGAPGD